jgi:hypothetical protein
MVSMFFKGVQDKESHQIQDKFSPPSQCIHCMAHRTNFQSPYSFFFHNLKWYIECFKLIDFMKAKGNKIL